MSGGTEETGLNKRVHGSSTLLTETGRAADADYGNATGIDISSNTDYTPSEPMHALVVTDNAGSASSGNLDVTLEGGGRMIIPCTVAANDHLVVLRGFRIATVHGDTTTTFDGLIFPIW